MPRLPSERVQLAILVISYVILGAILAPAYLYYINNDGIAYLSMAKTIAAGHAYDAFNTYWNPLFPLLIALGLKTGLSGLVAVKLVTLASGLAALLLLWNLKKLLPMRNDAWFAAMCTATGLSLACAIGVITPDLLLAAILLVYTHLQLNDRWKASRLWPLWIGLTIAVGYYTKTVALPFLVGHFFVMQVIGFASDHARRTRIITQTLLTYAITLVLIAPWIMFVAQKYGHVTLGDNAGYIHAVLNPVQGETMDIPMYTQGLLPPPHPLANSMWDEPTRTPYTNWSPLSSLGNVIYQLKIVYLNTATFFSHVLQPFFVFWFLLSASVVLAFRYKSSGQDPRLTQLARILAVGITLSLGLCLPLIIEERYFWWHVLLSIPLAAALLSLLLDYWKSNMLQRALIFALLFLSFTLYPAWVLLPRFAKDDALFAIAMKVDATYDLTGKRVAMDAWKTGLRIAYYADARFYGKPKAGTDDEIETELTKHAIDYYLVEDARARAFKNYEEVRKLEGTGNIRIYRKKAR